MIDETAGIQGKLLHGGHRTQEEVDERNTGRIAARGNLLQLRIEGKHGGGDDGPRFTRINMG